MINNQQIIENVLLENGAKSGEAVIKMNFIDLQKEASIFINTINELGYSLEVIKNKERGTKSVDFHQIYDGMRRYLKVVQDLTSAQYRFSLKWNEFQGKKVGLIYLDVDSNQVLITSEQNMAKFFSKYATTQYGRANITLNAERKKELVQNSTEEWQNIQKEIQSKTNESKYILDQAISRWKNPYMRYKNDEKTKKFKNSFYYRTSNWPYINWSRSFNTRGFMVEGYINALLNDAFINNPADFILQDDLNTLSDFVNLTSSTGGSQVQDISILLNDINYQFAVKSGKLSTERIGQYINIALVILSYDSTTAREDFLEDLKNGINFKKAAVQYLQRAKEQVKEKVKNFI